MGRCYPVAELQAQFRAFRLAVDSPVLPRAVLIISDALIALIAHPNFGKTNAILQSKCPKVANVKREVRG